MKLESKVNAHEGLGILPNSLKEVWLEIGGSCHLRCSYCFANSGGIDHSTENMNFNQIKTVLKDFVDLGGERIGIVGAGEPFHPKNLKYTFRVLEFMKLTEVKTTIFTTGDLLTTNLITRLEEFPNLRLLIKYNSQIPSIQDSIVNSKGYTLRREKVIDELIRRGFNNGRLGIVTSIFEENAEEMLVLLRYARDRNLVFDADTPLQRGRGVSCNKNKIDLIAKPIIERLCRIDREEYGNIWEPHASYIASQPCTRFNQHLYIRKDGTVSPCVGAQQIVLGNVKTEGLRDIWDKPLMRIIREHHYGGKCITCKNYRDKKCFSCLGRCTEDLTNEQLERHGVVKTIGCFQYNSV